MAARTVHPGRTVRPGITMSAASAVIPYRVEQGKRQEG